MRKVWQETLVIFTLLALATAVSFAQDSDAITKVDKSQNSARNIHVGPRGHLNGQAHARFGSTGFDSLITFNDHFDTFGYDSDGNPNYKWFTNTMGNPPAIGGTTKINAPIIPVIMDLRNFDGSPRYVKVDGGVVTTCTTDLTGCQPLVSDPTHAYNAGGGDLTQLLIQSPIFSNTAFSSSDVPTQVTDAVQRAEYYNHMKPNWHTVLSPVQKATRRMVLVRGTYSFRLNPDGSCCDFIEVAGGAFVNAFFPSGAPPFLPGTHDGDTPIGGAEFSGDITTKDMSTFFFPQVYLLSGGCCVIGFHSYDFELGDASNKNQERRYVLNYSSWINPGFFFDPTFLDITASSHEVAETYNDPFVASDGIHNIVPWWNSNGLCQNNLEDGDVIEVLPNATYPVQMANGFTYHPQNEALLPYFQRKSPSDALHGAYSYPNESTLAGISAPQTAGCQ